MLKDSPVILRDYTISEIDDVLDALALMINQKKCTDRERKKTFARIDYWLDRRLELKGGEE